MGPWRLELLRLWRTRRLIALAAAFLILGLGIPVLTYYLPELVKNAGNGVRIIAPKQTPTDAIAGFASNVAQLGTLVVVIVAAANLSIDARPALAAFYRTRLQRSALLVLPRYLVATAASVATLAVGTLGAWYETTVLLGHLPVEALSAGLALETLWLCFATSIVALFTSTTRSLGATIGGSIASLLALGLLGDLSATSSWLPTRLAGSEADILQHTDNNLWQTILITSLATLFALSLAVNRLSQRELYPAGSRREQKGG